MSIFFSYLFFIIIQNQAQISFYVVLSSDFLLFQIWWYAGATKSVYAPEPFDVGRFLQAEIVLNDEKATLSTTAPIDSGWVALLYYDSQDYCP